MEPTIFQGQTVLVSNMPYLFSKPKVGDIVVVKYSKRRHSGLSRISLLALGFAKRFWSPPRFALSPQNDGENNKYLAKRITKIDGEKYFVSGDNKKDSMDSRRFGWIRQVDILGKVVLRLKV